MEPWLRIVNDNLKGSAYFEIWDNLPYSIKCNIAESFYQYYKKKHNDKS